MPNYKKIYQDMIDINYPDKKETCKTLLSKEQMTIFDVMKINEIIFGSKIDHNHNSKYKAYTKKNILHILNYQRKENMNNVQLAKHFKISRNTIAKWKKIFNLNSLAK
jgi:hypothetical protein